jgi:hypothetical protein
MQISEKNARFLIIIMLFFSFVSEKEVRHGHMGDGALGGHVFFLLNIP